MIGWFGVAGIGALVLGLSVHGAHGDELPRWERRVFHAVNGLPDWLYVPLWPVMQLGNLVVGTLAGLVVALVAGDAGVAVGVVLAMVLKIVAEKPFREALRRRLPERVRPGTSQHGAILRGADVPATGQSFPSGHALLVAAIACIVAPVIPSGWEIVPFVLTVLVMAGRVYVAAHNPLDVTAGFGAGLVMGGIVAAIVGRS
jgi:undecaprenyl-diphosphatase